MLSKLNIGMDVGEEVMLHRLWGLEWWSQDGISLSEPPMDPITDICVVEEAKNAPPGYSVIELTGEWYLFCKMHPRWNWCCTTSYGKICIGVDWSREDPIDKFSFFVRAQVTQAKMRIYGRTKDFSSAAEKLAIYVLRGNFPLIVWKVSLFR